MQHAAQFTALAVEETRAIDHHAGEIEPSGHRVDFERERGHGEGMDDVVRGDEQSAGGLNGEEEMSVDGQLTQLARLKLGSKVMKAAPRIGMLVKKRPMRARPGSPRSRLHWRGGKEAKAIRVAADFCLEGRPGFLGKQGFDWCRCQAPRLLLDLGVLVEGEGEGYETTEAMQSHHEQQQIETMTLSQDIVLSLNSSGGSPR